MQYPLQVPLMGMTNWSKQILTAIQNDDDIYISKVEFGIGGYYIDVWLAYKYSDRSAYKSAVASLSATSPEVIMNQILSDTVMQENAQGVADDYDSPTAYAGSEFLENIALKVKYGQPVLDWYGLQAIKTNFDSNCVPANLLKFAGDEQLFATYYGSNILTKSTTILNAVNLIKGYTDSLETTVAALQTAVNTLSTKSDTIISATDTVETEIASVKAYVDTVETVLNQVKDYVDTLESGQTTIKGYTDTLETLVGALTNYDDATLIGKVDAIKGVVDAVKVVTDTVNSKHTTVTTKLDAIDAVVDAIKAHTDTLENYNDSGIVTIINAIKAVTDQLGNDEGNITTLISNLSTQVSNVATAVSAIPTDNTTGIMAELAILSGVITTINSIVNQVKSAALPSSLIT